MSINPEEFSNPDFNPKTWINSVLKSTHSKENEEDEAKETMVLVTKLQMASQDSSRQFEQLSNTTIKSMPRLLYELSLISEKAKRIQQKTSAAQEQLILLKGDTGGALEQLSRPHTVKTRMEKCQALFDERQAKIPNELSNENALQIHTLR